MNIKWKRIILVSLLLLPGIASSADTSKPFDHFNTGYPLEGAHMQVECETCHVRGIFKGTPTQCSGCHSAGSTISASKKPSHHIQSNENCGDCHTDKNWSSARMDHSSVTGSCLTCHNGTTATGKHALHVQSNNTCEDCHTSSAWIPARFDHSSVTATCSTCHNGTTATGKHATHIQSNNTCDDCHTSSAWIPARFDHTNITAACFYLSQWHDCHR